MYRTVSRIGLAIILLYAIATAAQVVVPQQPTPSPAGIPSGVNPPQPTATARNLMRMPQARLVVLIRPNRRC
jgi:hypothetical protein